MAKPLRPFVRGGGYYPSKKWIPLVRNGGYTTQNGGETEPVWATVSGAIASFTTPFAYPLKKLVAQINPVQDLHGQPNPYPAGGGKNKIDEDTVWASFLQSDGSFLGRGGDVSAIKYYIPTELVGTQLTFSAYIKKPSGSSISNIRVEATAGGSSNIGNLVNSESYTLSKVTFTPTATSDYVRIAYGDGSPYNLQFKDVQLEAGSSATSFAPYSNICPITGHTGLSVKVKGGNLLDKTGAVRGGFDASGNVLVNSGDSRCVTGFLEVKPNVTYYIDQTIPLTQGRAGFWYDENQTAISQISFNGAGVSSGAVTSPANAKYCRLGYLATNEDVCTMTVGTSALTPYEPYTSGTTTTVTFPDSAGTVYDGQDEVVSGNGTSTMGMVDLGTLTWVYTEETHIFNAAVPNIKEPASSYDRNKGIISSIYPPSVVIQINANMDDKAMLHAYGGIFIRDTSYSDPAIFKTAMSGQQLVYTLATPQTFTHTGQSVDTLVGQNNIWVTSGDVEVTYRIE